MLHASYYINVTREKVKFEKLQFEDNLNANQMLKHFLSEKLGI